MEVQIKYEPWSGTGPLGNNKGQFDTGKLYKVYLCNLDLRKLVYKTKIQLKSSNKNK